MKRILLPFIIFLMLLILPNEVLADTPHHLKFAVVKCDPTAPGMTAAKCRNNYRNGLLDNYIVQNNGNIDPGDTVMVVLKLDVGIPQTMIAMQTFWTFDETILTPLMNASGDNLLTSFYNAGFPQWYDPDNDEYKTGWISQVSLVGGREVRALFDDTIYWQPFNENLDLMYFFFKVKETATPGTTFGLTFDMHPGSTTGNDSGHDNGGFPNVLPMTSTNSIFTVGPTGGSSRDASLSNVTIKHGIITYPLTPTFVPGDVTNKEYSTIVPNQITSIDLDAAVNNEFATIQAGNLGNKELIVGNNTFNITVTSQYGDVEVYTIGVQRLSADAFLGQIELEGANLGILDPNYEDIYADPVPYAKTYTTITASPQSPQATLIGDGYWELTNYGALINKREILISAENCKLEYQTIQGNSCTTKTYTIYVLRNEPSNNAYLSDLTINGETVPFFVSDDFEYMGPAQENATTTVEIGATPMETTTTILSGTGTFNIDVGENIFNVVTEAEDGTQATYTIAIVRFSTDSTLENLEVISDPLGTLTPEFSRTYEGEYTYTFDGDVSEITVSATANDKMFAALCMEDTSFGSVFKCVHTPTSITQTFPATTSRITIETEPGEGPSRHTIINLNRMLSSNNRLSNLSISEGVILPEFTPDNSNYTATVANSVTQVDVIAETESSLATFSVNGNSNLQVGLNQIEVLVTAEDGTVGSYVVSLTREAKSDNFLTDLTVNNITVPDFNSNVLEYNLSDVPYSTTSINIGAVLSDHDASVTGTGLKELSTGNNSYDIIVTAQNEDVRIYTINIKREHNNNTYLSSLSVDGYSLTPVFNQNIYLYEITVEETKTTFSPAEVTAISEDVNATVVKQEEISLSTTLTNSYVITVKAENGIDSQEYTIVVNRPKSSDNSLINVDVTNAVLTPTFEPNVYTYTITVPYGDGNEFTILGTPNVSTSSVTGNGTYTKANSVVELEVTAENNETQVYTFNVEEAMNNDATLNQLSILNYNFGSIFDPNITTYDLGDIVFGTAELNIEAVPTDLNATIKYYVNDVEQISNLVEIPQVVGAGNLKIEVKAQDNTTFKEYIVSYNLINSNNAYLSSITSSVGNLEFNKTIYSYNLEVDNDVTNISFTAILEDVNASMSVLGGTYEAPHTINVENLAIGNNEVEILVTAQDGVTTKTYKINISRTTSPLSSNAHLSNLTISSGELIFDKNTFTYTVNVESTVTSIDVVAILEDDNASMTINNEIQTSPHTLTISPLNEGETKIRILVTAENGDINTYVLTINKSYGEELITSEVYGHVIENEYVKTAKNDQTTVLLKSQFDNDASSLEVWKADDSSKLADDEIVGTGMILKLIINELEVDRKIIVIRGDTSGEGVIDLFDAVKVLNHYLGRASLTGPYLQAAYVSPDDSVDLFDAVQILNHYLGRSLLH
jgi:hypothetical protein